MFGDVGIDVFGRLLAADAKALDQVPRGQSALPPGNGLNQTVAKCQVPADLFDGLLAFHNLSMCANTLPVQVYILDLSLNTTYRVFVF